MLSTMSSKSRFSDKFPYFDGGKLKDASGLNRLSFLLSSISAFVLSSVGSL